MAITGALLVGLASNCYTRRAVPIANTAPVAFGALGVPILVAGQVRESIRSTLAQWRTSVTVPVGSCAVLAGSNDGRLERGEETWPAALVAGGSFAVTQFFTSNYIGPELPDITSALASIVSLALFLKLGGRKIPKRQSAWTIRRCDGGE
ncbi:L-lactate permease [Shigella sonnei]